MQKPPLIVIVAGEMSGDLLGAGLIRSLKSKLPDARFTGIGGPQMLAEGFETLFPMERLSVMGLFAVLARLRELLHIRKAVRDYCLENRPAVYIGIDSPDFNLPLALKLKEAGIKTVHYVSPTVWAWRQKRIFKIKRAIDLMLCLFPFEEQFYKAHQMAVRFVGHPLAEIIPLEPDQASVRAELGLQVDGRYIALLPGSRGGELKYMTPLFLAVAARLFALYPSLKFIVPLANAARRNQFEHQMAAYQDTHGSVPPLILFDGKGREAMMAADSILLTSGTATLEATLAKRPMVVAYKWGALSHAIFSRLVKAPFIALPNLLAGKQIVPEFLQDAASEENLFNAMRRWIEEPDAVQTVMHEYFAIHHALKQNASELAAHAILELIDAAKEKSSN
ncbi:MAG TPA: lipid-A-disaccharide synthase [Pseudomonadales bacterium]|nr:lipid-A-disaccharide synthase [Pseudomonadales bacterium]